jgi:outer membrane receptor protein involved in Fe transport
MPTKSLLPYQDADSIAGAVNITTRSPFDRKGFALTGMAGTVTRRPAGVCDHVFSTLSGRRCVIE